ncbi:M14 family metallopeptidase [Lachnotalea glycerini]|uniref:Succinylglutamate desuccinylase n=1 Tax=Lachnotalea glycerini TaxID=1763509 RepID=A0A371JFI8_9FIRM|nr:M14 family metallopeptidase [Lachnotalea glycerini]RDY31478.1 succinylglutamate desuccinylase [Lachnotalea glycerini]
MFEVLTVKRGEKKQVELGVLGGKSKLPVTIIAGKEEGETLLITSGIHCTEYTGIQAAIELAQNIIPEQIKGTVILIHPVNQSGFEICNNSSVVPEDNKNLNRVFPGNKNGSAAEQLADFIVNHLYSLTDYYIDMHGGDIQEDLSPYVYYVTVTKDSVKDKAQQMAKRVNVNYMVGSKVGSYGAYNYAGSLGIPAILIERGCKGVWNHEEVELYQEDIKNVMRYLGILEDNKKEVSFESTELEQVHELCANNTGCWYPGKKAGESFKKGELAGEIKDYFGNVIEQIYFETDGIILYQTCSLCVGKNKEIIVYGERNG